MKPKIHPEYFTNVPVTCSCGNKLMVNSAASAIKVEVCSACHPYYTGKQKMIDAAGRIEQFNKRLNKAEDIHKSASAPKKKSRVIKKKAKAKPIIIR